jgi:Ca2+-binding RTX toxin-like protein
MANPIFSDIFDGNLLDNNTTNGLGSDDLIVLDNGNDSSDGGAGNDLIYGNGGNDTLVGGAGKDTLDGGADNDTYLFDTDLVLGSDLLIDASGTDTLNFAATTTKTINLNLGSTAAQTVTAGNLTLTLASATAFENVIGGSLNDNIVGNTLANSLTGGGGNDTLEGGAGDDTLDGGADNDTYRFDTDLVLGSDLLIDASGTDTLNFAATTTKTINLNLGSTAAQTVTAGNLTLTLASATAFENVIGGSLNDNIVGNTLANSLTGGGGNDTLEGGLGQDSLTGGTGNDFFRLTEVSLISLPSPNPINPQSRDLITDFSVPADTIILANSLDSTLAGLISPGIKGLSFVGGNVPGNVLDPLWFFKGPGEDGRPLGKLSGIYVNTSDGNIWYNDANAAGSYLIANVGPNVAFGMTNADFVYGL